MADPVVACGPTDQECRALVDRICASQEFRRANRLRDFLRFAVDRKLADAPHELTEAQIGHRVFGRPSMYNTGEDSIVRTEARVLRQRLDRYFSKEGVAEPILLEIPKGSYVPVFRWRDYPVLQTTPQPAPPKSRVGMGRWMALAGSVVGVALFVWYSFPRTRGRAESPAVVPDPAIGAVTLESSDPQLARSFEWAKGRALGYTYTGDPVGAWYDSTAGTRYAFCMRDTSHQGTGAAVLGLTSHTHNMLRRFAASISPTRDWCGFWEINKDGFPAPIDYQDDRHFWYCLPANFDVMQACYRQYLWTGDENYFDSVFSNFYDRTVTDYVAAWDHDHDGILDSNPQVLPRGYPSYYQHEPKALVVGDLIAAQYKGYLVYAAIQRRKGSKGSLSQRLADEYLAKAQSLRLRYNTEWWNPIQNRHYSVLLPDRTFYPGYVDEGNVFALLFGLTEDGFKTEAALDSLEKNRPDYDQKLSYFPEILFQYGRNESAYQHLLELTDPNFRSRGMPEIVFAVVGSVATGLMGISPDASSYTLETLPRLPKTLEYVALKKLPVLRNEISVAHRSTVESTLMNEKGPAIEWRATFPISTTDRDPHILVDGTRAPATIDRHLNNQLVGSVLVRVPPGQTRTARYVAPPI
jgi:hypothetical protein